jgi:hypothetical protein
VCPGGGSCNVVVSLYLNDTSEAQLRKKKKKKKKIIIFIIEKKKKN